MQELRKKNKARLRIYKSQADKLLHRVRWAREASLEESEVTYSRQHKRYLIRSPLRYPGSKAFLFDIIRNTVNKNRFIEGFAGSAILSLNMKREGKIIHINDLDPAIYAIWKNIQENSSEFAKMVLFTSIDIDQYRKCSEILKSERRPTLELAYSALSLNRTNFSGMLGAKVIGGGIPDR